MQSTFGARGAAVYALLASLSLLALWTPVQAQVEAEAGPPAPVVQDAPAPDASGASDKSADYEVALSEALSAHARGDYAQARVFMERAHELDPSARTLRGLGIVAFAQGRHIAAIQHLDAALASQAKPLPPELRTSVEELLTHAWGQVGKYELVIDPDSGDFLIDGQAPDYYAPKTVVLAPGEHVLTARAPARAPYEVTLNVKPGDRRTLHVVLAVPPAPTVATKAKGLATAPDDSPWTRKGRWISVGAGVALVAAGAAVYTLARVRLEQVVDKCRNMADGFCTRPQAVSLYRSRNIEGLGITSAALGSAGVLTLLTTAAVEIARRRRTDQEPRPKPLNVALGYGSLLVSGNF